MSQSEKGRFCENCCKCVTDFTKLSEEQLLELFNVGTGKVCGRFYPNQLDHFLAGKHNIKGTRIFPQLLVSAALTVGLVNKSSAKEFALKNFQVQSEIVAEKDKDVAKPIGGNSSKYISGKIVDCGSKEVLPFANILIKNTKYGVNSDIDGNFKLIISDSLDEKKKYFTNCLYWL